MIRRPPRSTPLYSSAASDVYKRQPRGVPPQENDALGASRHHTDGPSALLQFEEGDGQRQVRLPRFPEQSRVGEGPREHGLPEGVERVLRKGAVISKELSCWDRTYRHHMICVIGVWCLASAGSEGI